MRHRSVFTSLIAALAAVLIAAGLPVSPAAAVPRLAAADGANLAAGRPVSASSTQNGYPAGNATDGNQGTYWESANHAFPQWIQVDLGRAVSVNELVLRLPAHWESRTQTIEVRGSLDGSTFTRLAAPAAHLFNPAATITFGTAQARYIRLDITANTGWPAGQISEFEVYGPDQNPDPNPGTGTDLALGKPIEASSHTWIYVPGNANDGDVTTYWEGDGHPSTLTVSLGANADISSVVLKLNPDPVWARRTQTIQVLGRTQDGDSFTNLVSAADYTFDPATGNTVTIPVDGRAADVRLRFTANSGAPGGQVAEFQVYGEPAPNPDLTVTDVSWTPANPAETDAITLSATVRNTGTVASGATDVAFRLGDTEAGTAPVGSLAPGATATVTRNIGARDAGTHSVVAVVDPENKVIERDEGNNMHTASSPLVIRPVDSSDLVAAAVSWTPGNPAAGDEVTFTVTLKNQGTVASAGGSHGITLTVVDSDGDVVRTLNGAFTGVIAPGATTAPVTLGTWTAANGEYTVRTVVEPLLDDVLRGGQASLISVGFLLSLWSGSRAMFVYVDLIALAYGLGETRGIIRTRLMSFGLYVAALLVGLVVMPILVVGPTLLSEALPRYEVLVAVFYWPVVIIGSVLMLSVLYHVSVPLRTRWWREVPGAALALVIWILCAAVLREVLAAWFAPLSIYGSLAAPIAVLLWLYITALAVLIGATLNAEVDRLWPLNGSARGAAQRTGQTIGKES